MIQGSKVPREEKDIALPKVALLCSGCSHVRRGLEIFHEDLRRALAAVGLQADLFGGSRGPGTTVIPGLGLLPLRWLRDTRRGLIWEQKIFAFAAASRLQAKGYDIAMVSERAVANTLLRIHSGKGRGLPRLCYNTSAGLDPVKTLRYDCVRHATRSAYAAALEHGFPEARMRFIPHGCEIATATPARTRFGIPEGAFAIAYSGAFVEEKRHSALVEALCKVQDQIPGLFVLFAGAPGPTFEPTRRKLEERFARSYFCETLTAAEMPAFYASADLYAHARLRESFGNAFVQAQMQRVPVIANRTDIHQEVLGADGAFFVDLESPEALADAIRTLYGSPELRGILSGAGRQNVLRFSWERIAPSFLEMFKDFSALPPAK